MKDQSASGNAINRLGIINREEVIINTSYFNTHNGPTFIDGYTTSQEYKIQTGYLKKSLRTTEDDNIDAVDMWLSGEINSEELKELIVE